MSKRLQPVILKYDSLPSTNSEAAKQATRGAAEGVCIVAREQSAGRGRQQRAWVSPQDGGLYFSIVLRPRIEVRSWPLITLMASLAVADGLVEACQLQTDIKWPNDVQSNGRKVCGILAETVDTDLGRAVILGIGINLIANALPKELCEVATSVEQETGYTTDSEVLLRSVIHALDRKYEELHQPGGDEVMLREWTARSSYANGRRVRVTLEDGILVGVTRGVASDGALRVETDAHEIRIVRAGDVTALRSILSNDPNE